MTTRLTMKLWPEAANALGVSRTTIYKLAKDGSLPTIKLGSRVLVPIAARPQRFSAAYDWQVIIASVEDTGRLPRAPTQPPGYSTG